MAARRKKNPYRLRIEPWAPHFVAIFGPLVSDWTPPAMVRVWPGKAHVTVSGVFQSSRPIPTAKVCTNAGVLRVGFEK